MTPRSSLLNALIVLVCLLLQPKGIHASDELGLDVDTKGMPREMFLMKDQTWELQPADFSCLKNLKLRRHCRKFLSHPVQMKLSNRRGKFGLRAQGQLQSGKRLRGFWRPTKPSPTGVDICDLSYDEAVKHRLKTIEFEVQLPPIDKKSKKLPSVIYSIEVENGTFNPKAIVPRGSGTVRVLPEGRVESEEVYTLNAGKAFVTHPMRSGIVDPGWAKGRSVFRKGRPTGLV